MKQETLEVAAENSFKYIDHRNSFIAGANWQQEQDKNKYSEEDMKQFAFECVGNFLSNNDNKVEIKLVDVIIDRVNDNFEQFKTKNNEKHTRITNGQTK